MMSFSVFACGKGTEAQEDIEEIIEEIDEEAEKEPAVEETSAEESAEPESASDKESESSGEKEETSKEKTDTEAAKEASKEASSEEKSEEVAKEAADSASVQASSVNQAEASAEASVAQEQPEVAAAQKAPEQVGYGRILFTGDSRTVDMFSEDASEIRGDVYNGIPVYCRNGAKFEYMVGAIDEYGIDNFDTLVSWMGCNDFGNFSQYGPYYDQLLAQGKQIVVCTVGPTVDECLLDDMDWYYYPNSNQINYNNSLKAWANSKGVKVIDLYSYISNSTTITVVPTDGIHYLPQPTTELWNLILGYLQ